MNEKTLEKPEDIQDRLVALVMESVDSADDQATGFIQIEQAYQLARIADVMERWQEEGMNCRFKGTLTQERGGAGP